jgi:signal peptidase I
MTSRTATVVARLLDLVLPGTGMLWAGRRNEGWNAILAWAFLPSLMATAVALLDLDPRRAVIALCVVYGAIQSLLWLTPLGTVDAPRAARAVAGGLAFAVLLGLAALSVSRSVTTVTVPDHGEWPGLLPGEEVLVRRVDYLQSPPDNGELVAARTQKGILLARVEAGAGDVIEVSGPTLRLNGAEVAADDLGDLRLAGAEADSSEAKNLRTWRERCGVPNHLVFFARGVTMAPVKAVVPEGHVFLLADNRSTAQASDSRARGPVALHDLVGRVEMVLWSPGPDLAPRWDRIGARWP